MMLWLRTLMFFLILTEQLRSAGYLVVSGPRTTGDGYYESCIVTVEGNQIELTE